MSDPAALSPEEFAGLLEQSSATVVLTGAGISTSAGIPDFRGPQGLYNSGKYDPGKVFDIDYFRHNPEMFFDFSRELLASICELKPTFTHRFLADLERVGKLACLITQNIDPLHYLAGSKNVIPIHGNYETSHCMGCEKEYPFAHLVKVLPGCRVPRCDCGGVIKPDVVFFGEAVNGMEEAARAAAESELFLALGTSLEVHPAAMLPDFAPGKVVVVNKGRTALPPGANRFFINADLDGFFGEVAGRNRDELGI